MNTQTLHLQATKSTIQGVAHLIDQLNNNSPYDYKYKVDLNDPGESKIEITSDEPKAFYALGIASHDLMKRMIVIK